MKGIGTGEAANSKVYSGRMIFLHKHKLENECERCRKCVQRKKKIKISANVVRDFSLQVLHFSSRNKM
jgi:hypothetical protein